MNSSQTDHALPLKLPNRFSSLSWYISGTACLIICHSIALFVMPANGETILLITYTSSALLTQRSWRWISEWHWISWVANPSVWKTLSTVLVLNLFMFYCRWGQTMRDWWHLKVTPAARRNRKIVHWNWSPQQGGNREVKKKPHVQLVAMLNCHKYSIMKKQIVKSTLCTWGVCL